jgi:hypothetical protein
MKIASLNQSQIRDATHLDPNANVSRKLNAYFNPTHNPPPPPIHPHA